MIERVVKDIVLKYLQEHVAHSLIPGAMHAQVVGRTDLGTKYEYKDMTIDACDQCGPIVEKKIIGKWYEYSLQILDKDGQPDPDYPQIPQVKSKVQIEPGGKAAVVMLYGELRPFIIGEAM